MSEQEEWLERKRRMVKCSRHGLHFDPKLASGCPRCVKEAAKIRPRRPPQLFIILLCFLAFAVVLYKFLGPEHRSSSPTIRGLESTEGATGEPLTLEAERFRQPVRALEQTLFSTPVESGSDLADIGPRLVSSVSTLVNQLKDNFGTEHPTVKAFTLFANSIPSQSFTFQDLENSRTEWLKIRRRYLKPAPWMFQPAPTAVRKERASLAEYRDITNHLISLIEDGASEAEALAGSSEPGRQWREFLPGWQEQLNDLAGRQPKRPREQANAQLLLGFQNLQKAFSQTRNLAQKKTPPSSTAPLDQALEQARDALRAFDEADI